MWPPHASDGQGISAARRRFSGLAAIRPCVQWAKEVTGSQVNPSSQPGIISQQITALTLLDLPPESDASVYQSGIHQTSQVTSTFVLCLDLGLFTLLAGICGIRASTDIERIVPYLVLSSTLFLCKAAITVTLILKGSFVPSTSDLVVLILTAAAVLLGISVNQQREKPDSSDPHSLGS